jgi:acyl-CoA dehydrogenase
MLQEAIRRFMRGEVIPAEDQVEHDAYRLPDEMLAGLRAKAKSRQMPDGRLCARLWRIWCGSAQCGVPGHPAPDPQVRRTRRRARRQGVRRDLRGLGRRRSGALDPHARRAQGRPLRAQRQQDVDHGGEGADWGLVFARTGEQGDRGGITCFIVDGRPRA